MSPVLPKRPVLEEEVWQGRPSLYCYLGDWVAGLLLLPLGVGVFILLRAILARAFTRFSLTTTRATMQFGILSRTSNEVRLSDIRSINVRRSGLGGLFGIGTLDLSSSATGQAEVYFLGVEDVENVREMVRFGQAGGDMAEESVRLSLGAARRGDGYLLRVLVTCVFVVAVPLSLWATCLTGAYAIGRWARPAEAASVKTVVPPTPETTPVPTTTVASTPAPTFAEQVTTSQRRAVNRYPDLGKANSPLNQRFVVKLSDWRSRGDLRLSRPDWPERLADEVAASR